MPINYEPPAPFAPGISAGYGAAEIATRDLPIIAQQYARNQQMAFDAQQQAQAARQQAAQADQRASLGYAQLGAQVSQQGQEQAAARSERQAEFAASREPSGRDAFLAQVAGEQNQQRAQLQAWLSQQEVGQAEQMRYQRMKNAVDEISSNPALTAEDKQDLLSKAKYGMTQTELRLKRDDDQRKVEQLKQLKERNTLLSALHGEDRAAAAAAAKSLIFNLPGRIDESGVPIEFQVNKDGLIVPVERPKATTGTAHLDRIENMISTETKRAQDQWHTAVKEATQTVDRWRNETEKDANGVPHVKYPEYADEKFYEDAITAQIAKRTGFDIKKGELPSYDAHLARHLSRFSRYMGAATGGTPQATGGGGDFGQPTSGRAPPTPQEAEAARGRFGQRAGTIANMPELQPQERQQGVQAATQAAQLYQSVGGDVSRLPPEQKALYDNAIELQDALIVLARRRRQGPAAPMTELERRQLFSRSKFQ